MWVGPHAAAAAAAAGMSGTAPPEQLYGRVMVVEDNTVNMEYAAALLDKLGLSVVKAWSGREAIDLWRSQSVDLVLMDCQMPGMDGYEASRRIREIESKEGLRRTCIVALTANALAEDRAACLSCARCFDYCPGASGCAVEEPEEMRL